MADMYDVALETIERSNFRRYEVSNFSKSNNDESIHNWNYWKGGDYVGIGPGAHSRFWPKIFEEKGRKIESEVRFREARIQTLEPDPWMFEVEKFGHGTRKIEHLKSPSTILSELFATSLRTRIGLTEEMWNGAWSKLFENNLSECQKPPISIIDIVKSDDKCRTFLSENIFVTDDGLKLSRKGLNLLDFCLPYLINSLENNLSKL